MPLLIAPLLLAASLTEKAGAQAELAESVRFEIAGGPLLRSEYDDDGGALERRGPGISGSATFRITKRLAFEADAAWIRMTDDYPTQYSATVTGIAWSASLLWHFRNRPVQPYLGIGATQFKSDYCYEQPAGCHGSTIASPVLLGGVKFVNYRNGLVIAPEIRLEYMSVRLGLSVGKAWLRRK